MWAELGLKRIFLHTVQGTYIYMYFYMLKFISPQTLTFLFPKPLHFFLLGKNSRLLFCLMTCETREFDKGYKTVHQSDLVSTD